MVGSLPVRTASLSAGLTLGIFGLFDRGSGSGSAIPSDIRFRTWSRVFGSGVVCCLRWLIRLRYWKSNFLSLSWLMSLISLGERVCFLMMVMSCLHLFILLLFVWFVEWLTGVVASMYAG